MAIATTGYNWASGATVTPARLNAMVNSATVTLADGEVGTAKLADSAVTAAKLATDAVETAKIKDANVTAGKLAADAVETAKIKDGNVTAGKLAADAVTTAKILDANVTAGKLASAAVTAPKLNGVGKDTSGDDLAVGTAPVFGVRAWVRFDGTRNAADSGASVAGQAVKIFGAGNVTSVVRTGSGTGRFTVNFTVEAPHTGYMAVANYNEGNSDVRNGNGGQASCHSHAAGSVQVVCADGSSEKTPGVCEVLVIY